MNTSGKVAIVTGGGQGIGKAVVGRMLRDGLRVVFAEMDDEAGRETEEQFAQPDELLLVRADISEEDDVKKMVEAAEAKFGRIDILVNNAGIFLQKSLTACDLGEWNRVISINLTGPFLCAKYAAPHLKKTKGTIINISSIRGLMSEPHTEAYSASKGGVVGLTHALALSLGPEVRVNCISPGWIDVSGWKKKSALRKQELTEKDHSQHPAGRVGRPEDIASMISYLASPEAEFITGANFIVDGGMTRKMIFI